MDFLNAFNEIITKVGSFVWGPPMMILLVGTGLWLTINLKGIQFTKMFYALYLALIKRKEKTDQPGDISHFQALMTALSATVGTGNIAGVATAIAAGGPGALFWMWITGLVGMATKYAEAILAVTYRETDEKGEMNGGPMYYISRGLNMPWLGTLFAFFATIASFGIGNMVQSNSVAAAVEATFHVSPVITGIVLMVLTAIVVLGGIKKIGQVTGVLVPVMIVFYVIGSLLILFMNAAAIPEAFKLIFHHAFNPTAATGGFAGATVMYAMRMGVARGIFSNESGLGSAPIAAAAAQTKYPATQALVSMTQVFIDTILVCTMTGLVLIRWRTDCYHRTDTLCVFHHSGMVLLRGKIHCLFIRSKFHYALSDRILPDRGSWRHFQTEYCLEPFRYIQRSHGSPQPGWSLAADPCDCQKDQRIF